MIKITRGARRYLLGLLERATTPLYVFTYIRGRPPAADIARVSDEIRRAAPSWGSLLVLPAEHELAIISPRPSGVRVVAGKGARRRGIRRDGPPRIRIVHSETHATADASRWDVNVRLPEYPKRIDLAPASFSVSNG